MNIHTIESRFHKKLEFPGFGKSLGTGPLTWIGKKSLSAILRKEFDKLCKCLSQTKEFQSSWAKISSHPTIRLSADCRAPSSSDIGNTVIKAKFRREQLGLIEIAESVLYRFQSDDSLSQALNIWCHEYKLALQNEVNDPTQIEEVFLNLASTLLKDSFPIQTDVNGSIFFPPLDENSFLTSDGKIIGEKMATIYMSQYEESPFTLQPHLPAQFFTQWLKEKEKLKTCPEIDLLYQQIEHRSLPITSQIQLSFESLIHRDLMQLYLEIQPHTTEIAIQIKDWLRNFCMHIQQSKNIEFENFSQQLQLIVDSLKLPVNREEYLKSKGVTSILSSLFTSSRRQRLISMLAARKIAEQNMQQTLQQAILDPFNEIRNEMQQSELEIQSIIEAEKQRNLAIKTELTNQIHSLQNELDTLSNNVSNLENSLNSTDVTLNQVEIEHKKLKISIQTIEKTAKEIEENKLTTILLGGLGIVVSVAVTIALSSSGVGVAIGPKSFTLIFIG